MQQQEQVEESLGVARRARDEGARLPGSAHVAAQLELLDPDFSPDVHLRPAARPAARLPVPSGRDAYAAERLFEARGGRVRVLGVDPGLTRCGLGVVEGVPGRAVLVAVGVARTSADAPLGERLVALEVAFEAWLDRHRPDAVAVERVFAQANVRTVMGTAQAGAVAVVCAARRGLPVALHTPSEVKAAVTGSGRADKAQVALMVARLLRLDAPPRPADAADALALALCQVWRGPALARLAAATRPGVRA